MERDGTPLREMVAERRVARVAGMRYDRYYDGLAQRQDGTWVGIEVKHGSSPYGGDQSAFDALVSPDNPAHATLPDGRTIKIIDVIYEEVPRQ
ncbi:hypothetical protein [Actinomyces wuliandei]|uniref:hypothetical protein n=1 Tax=Actinomyces wuliandei TaxID=2057743 RepID=UPI00111875E8|nr:hypothetical protein [Actinomyces wuliandei]